MIPIIILFVCEFISYSITLYVISKLQGLDKLILYLATKLHILRYTTLNVIRLLKYFLPSLIFLSSIYTMIRQKGTKRNLVFAILTYTFILPIISPISSISAIMKTYILGSNNITLIEILTIGIALSTLYIIEIYVIRINEYSKHFRELGIDCAELASLLRKQVVLMLSITFFALSITLLLWYIFPQPRLSILEEYLYLGVILLALAGLLALIEYKEHI